MSLAILLIGLSLTLTAFGIYRYAMHALASAPPRSEIAVVLGATSHGNEPTPVFLARIEYAIQLYRQGLVSKILFTGAPGEPPQAIVARNLALQRGLPKSDLLIETQSLTTYENLLFAKDWIGDPEKTTLLIVSDPLHLRRAMLMAEDLQLRAAPAPVPQSRIQSGVSQAKFLLRETLAYWKYLLLRTVHPK